MKNIVRYVLISLICISVVFTATAVALGLYFDPSVAHMTIEDNSRTAQGRFDGLTLIEIKSALGSRADLGRPTLTARQNVENFMNYLKEKN